MDKPYWHKQTTGTPLFPDLLWSRPENKTFAGKLGIIGGNAHGFAAAADAYSAAEKAGVGTARVLLPDSLQKTVGRVFSAGEYAPSTPSGSFSQQALAEVLSLALWADALLLAGDLGHNSETAILLEQTATKYNGPLTITNDAANYFVTSTQALLGRPKTLLVLSFAQLQKLATSLHFTQAFTFSTDFLHLIDLLHDFTAHYHLHIIVSHLDNLFLAVEGAVTAARTTSDQTLGCAKTASSATVWWLQNPGKAFEAMSCSFITDDNGV